MFDARGGEYDSYYANIKKHLGHKAARELSTELDEKMDAALKANAGIDPHLVMAYMDVIQELESHAIEDQNLDNSIERFVSAHPEWFSASKANEQNTKLAFAPQKSTRSARKSLGLLKLLVAAMGITMALLVASYGQQAWDTAIEIGNEILHIGPGQSGELELDTVGPSGYCSLVQALDDYNITQIAPNWIPGELSVQSINIQEAGEISVFTALYSGKDSECVVRIKKYAEKLPDIGYEMSKDTERIYSAGGVKHYLVLNNDRITAVWENGTCYCSISGTISEEQMKKIIDSIYERERF